MQGFTGCRVSLPFELWLRNLSVMLKLKLLRWVVCEGKRNLSQLSANGNELHVGVNFTTLNSSPLSLAAVSEWKVWLSHSFMILTWTQGANDGFLSSRLFWICFSSSPDFINLHTMCVNRKGGETTDTFRKWIPELWLLLDLKILFLAKNIGFHSTAVGQYDKKKSNRNASGHFYHFWDVRCFTIYRFSNVCEK